MEFFFEFIEVGKVQKFIKLLSQENGFACEHCLVISYEV